ncbi:MAG: FIST C-terminal domain-containing protein, partial [Deltaproteobacteria bacterium]|nr:FIST C-terminal domain-containing protein [Deltaproteobacteria bacterium]
GAIGGGREHERGAAVALTAGVLPGVAIAPFHLEDDPERWRRAIRTSAADDPAFVLFASPRAPVEEMVAWMDERWPVAVKVGALASGGALFLGDRTLTRGAVGLALTGDVVIDPVVAQGARPIGPLMFVTRASRNMVLELDGGPALTALERVHATLPPEEQELVKRGLCLGIAARDGQAQYKRGDFLVRALVGVDPETQAIAVGGRVDVGSVVQLHVRDARAAALELAELLADHDHVTPSGALLFSCVARGHGLFGVGDHDSALFTRAMGPVPLGGFFANGEIGPVQRRTCVHSQTSAFALFRRRAAEA